jgi:cilia- and flagella-associated protein 43
MKTVKKYKRKIQEKKDQNQQLEGQLTDLESSVTERKQIHDVQGDYPHLFFRCIFLLKLIKFLVCLVKRQQATAGAAGDKPVLKEIYTRRKLIDLAKSQAQDIAILREEVERLRLRTYPAFPTTQISNMY